MYLLAFLQMLDFILTWIGLNKLKVIEEGNPFMQFLFKKHFISATIIRVFMVVFILLLLKAIKLVIYPVYLIILIIGVCANLYVLKLHLEWLFIYFEYGDMNENKKEI